MAFGGHLKTKEGLFFKMCKIKKKHSTGKILKPIYKFQIF